MKKKPASPVGAQPGRDENTVEMFPELLPPARPPVMSPAERQRRARLKKKALRESVGLMPVALRQDEREALAQGVLLLEFAGPTLGVEARQALLQKLTPGAQWVDDSVDQSWRGCSMPAPCRDTDPLDTTLHLSRFDMGLLWLAVDVLETARSDLKHRESPLVWASLERIFGGANLGFDWKERLGRDSAILIQRKRDREKAQLGWKAHEDVCQRNRKLVDELHAARLEVIRLQQTLAQIADELAAPVGAPEPVGLPIVADLQARIRRLEDENSQVVIEREKAFCAVERLQQRLQQAKLPHDYRPQPGETGYLQNT